MEKPSNKETELEGEAPQSGKKKRKAATQQGDCASSRIAGPSSGTSETRVNSKRKPTKPRKESQKKKQRKVDLSGLDDSEKFDGKSYYEDLYSPNDLVLAEPSDSLTENIDDNEGKSSLTTTDAKKRKTAAQEGDCISSRIVGPSSSTVKTRVNTERKISKAKTEGHKKKQRKTNLSAQDDTEELDGKLDYENINSPKDPILAEIANSLAEKIDENASKSNLSTANVKSLLHHLLTDKLLLDFAQRLALDATDSELRTTDSLAVETRLTRSKWKKSRKQDDTEQRKFFETELEEDSEEDEEYDPYSEKLILPSDDDSIPTPHSCLRSPSLPKTPEPQSEEPDSFEDPELQIQAEDDSLFKIPGEPVSASKKNDTSECGEELIAYRTRSKISMKDLSLETLTASLDPPDYDPALYDFNQVDETDPDDIEWKNWLNGLFQDNVDESFDEHDEDFNFMGAEEEVDQEEFRTDKGVVITQRELQDLLDGILDDFGENIKDQSTILKYVVPKFDISVSERLQISAQLQQHTQLLTQMCLLCYKNPTLEKEANNTKMLLKELASFRMTVENDEGLINKSIYYLAGLDDATRIIDSLNETTQLEMKLIEKNAMPVVKEGQLKQRSHRDLSVNIQPQIALRIMTEPYFATYPELLPEQGRLEPRDVKRLSFFKSEDSLLALGVEQFGKKFDLISNYLMPAATPMQLKTRFKNLLSKREYVDNPVMLFKRTNKLPPLDSGLCIKLPRVKSSVTIKDAFQEMSSMYKLPLWIEKFMGLLKRLEHCEGERSIGNVPTISMKVHYGRVYRSIYPNGPLPVSTAALCIPKQPARVLNTNSQSKIFVETTAPCVLELTLPRQPMLNVQERGNSKPQKIVSVARSVQTDGDFKTLSATSPQPDEKEALVESPIDLKSLSDSASEQEPCRSTESHTLASAHSSCTTSSLLPNHQQTTEELQSSGSMLTNNVSPVLLPKDDCHSVPVQVSSTAASPLLDASFQNSQISSASSFGELFSKPKNKLLSEGCGTGQIGEAVSCSDIASSNALVSSSHEAKDLRTGQASSSTEQTEPLKCNSINISEHPVKSTSSPLNASIGDIKSCTGCLTEIAAMERNMALPPEGGTVSQENERAERNDVMASGTIEKFETPNIESQTDSLPEAASSVLHQKNYKEIECSSMKSVSEADLIEDGLEDAQESSFIEDPVPEGATSEVDMQADAQSSRDAPAVEEHKLSPDDRMKETFKDLPPQELRVESNQESPNGKSSQRTSVNTRRKKSTRNLKFDWEEKLEEKASKFADLYFEKVKETLLDKPDLYCHFLRVIDEAGRSGMNRVKVYWKLANLLADYPDLVEMFVGFLEPSQAKEVGQFEAWLEFDKARNFLLNCESFYMKTKLYHELLKKTIELHETEKDSKKVIKSIKSLFRGNDKLAAEMTELFPDSSPPQSRSEDFELIRYLPEKTDFDHVDEFEEVHLKPCDYIDAEEPQQKRRTILDDFAAWLQKPALNTHEVCSDKKPESPISSKVDKQQNCWQDLLKDDTSRLEITGDKALSLSPFDGTTMPAEKSIMQSDCQADVTSIENSEKMDINLYDTEPGDLNSLYQNISSLNESSSYIDNFKAGEKIVIGDIDTLRDNHARGDASPEFESPLSRRNQFSKQSKSELSYCETSNQNSPTDCLINKKGTTSRDVVKDLIPNSQSEMHVPSETCISPVALQSSFSITERTHSSHRTPISGKRESRKLFQNVSPIGTRLRTIRINSKSSSRASGFLGIETLGEGMESQASDKNASKLSTSTIAGDEGSRYDGKIGECKGDGIETSNEDRNIHKSDGISAGDIIYDDGGKIIYKWSREDDRLILLACQKDGASEATFRNIAEKLNGCTMAQVEQRFTKLMELLSVTGSD